MADKISQRRWGEDCDLSAHDRKKLERSNSRVPNKSNNILFGSAGALGSKSGKV